MKFVKMQCSGNDYIIVDAIRVDLENQNELARTLCDRHFGIGADGLVIVQRSSKADFKMVMYNSDGSEGLVCGNGIRCLGKYVYDSHRTDKEDLKVETASGVRKLKLYPGKFGLIDKVAVEMGQPDFNATKVPVIFPKDQFINEPLEVGGKLYRATCVSMGNPHVVVTMDEDIGKLDIEKIGPGFSKHASFPKSVNTEFINIIDEKHINVRVWEKGNGETLSCGSAACAAVAAAVASQKAKGTVEVKMKGGSLFVKFDDKNHQITLSGPVETVYSGEIDIDQEEIEEKDVKIYKK